MKKTKKARLNLYINEDIIQFAKDWSYVTNKPISKMLEEHINRQKEIVLSTTPFQWLNDPYINPSLLLEDEYFRDLDDYIQNREEEKFCEENPGHPRAKMRRALLKEHEEYIQEKIERQKEKEKELIKRWMEVFSMK
jgi:hypothetical protein